MTKEKKNQKLSCANGAHIELFKMLLSIKIVAFDNDKWYYCIFVQSKPLNVRLLENKKLLLVIIVRTASVKFDLKPNYRIKKNTHTLNYYILIVSNLKHNT